MTRLYMPIAYGGPKAVAGATSGGGVEAASSPRDEFARAWLAHPLQQRRNCREDHRLTAAALWMCRDMAARAEAGTLRGDLHRDSLGRNANERVRTYYPLPLAYEDHLNYVESVAVDHRGPGEALAMLLDSPSHHDHIVGAGWFGTQTRYGLSFVAPAWWVVLTAPPPGDNQGDLRSHSNSLLSSSSVGRLREVEGVG